MQFKPGDLVKYNDPKVSKEKFIILAIYKSTTEKFGPMLGTMFGTANQKLAEDYFDRKRAEDLLEPINDGKNSTSILLDDEVVIIHTTNVHLCHYDSNEDAQHLLKRDNNEL